MKEILSEAITKKYDEFVRVTDILKIRDSIKYTKNSKSKSNSKKEQIDLENTIFDLEKDLILLQLKLVFENGLVFKEEQEDYFYNFKSEKTKDFDYKDIMYQLSKIYNSKDDDIDLYNKYFTNCKIKLNHLHQKLDNERNRLKDINDFFSLSESSAISDFNYVKMIDDIQNNENTLMYIEILKKDIKLTELAFVCINGYVF